MTIRVIRNTKVGFGYRSDIRLMIFYVEVEGEERMLVALMPLGCKAESESDFEVDAVSHIARCGRDCTTCQFSRILEPMSFEDLEARHGIQFPRESVSMPETTADSIWSRVTFPPPASVQVELDLP